MARARVRWPAIVGEFTPEHRGGTGPPLVCLHGFTDTWRTWELVLPALERRHDVLTPTLAGHAGGPLLSPGGDETALLDALEGTMDAAGFATAHVVGNSLGGYLALKLAERGRARSVVALAPAGGWAAGRTDSADTLGYFTRMQAQVRQAAPYADAIVSTPAGRRAATQYVTENYRHLPPPLVAHLIRGAAECAGGAILIERARVDEWDLSPERISCPVRVVWGTKDRLLPWPSAAVRYRNEWLPHADWIELDGVGHCPQLDVPVETAQLILGFTV